MTSRGVYLVVLLCIATGVATDNYPDDSGDEIIELDFPDHPAVYCDIYTHPHEMVYEGPSVNFTLHHLSGDSHRDSLRDTYYCTLEGDDGDLKQLAEDNIVSTRPENLTDAERVLALGPVQCVRPPDSYLPDELFDFRLKPLKLGMVSKLCLHLDAARRASVAYPPSDRPAPPERNALVFRFDFVGVPDLVCHLTMDASLPESDLDMWGFIHGEDGPLYCRFRPVSEAQTTAQLLWRLSDEMPGAMVLRPDDPATLWLPHYTCTVAVPGDQLAPSKAQVVASSSSGYLTFIVTGPTGRWAFCWMSLK